MRSAGHGRCYGTAEDMAKRRAGKARWGGLGQVIEADKGQVRVGYWCDGGQSAMQETTLTARWREGQVEIKPNGMAGAERKR